MRHAPIALAVSLFALPLLVAPAAAATVDVFIENATIPQPISTVTGHLDVFITDATAVPTFSYNAEVDLSSTSGVSFTSANSNTSNHTPAYPTGNFFNIVTAGVVQAANDTTPTVTPLNNNAGLFQVNYQITPSAVGTYNLTFNPADSFIFDNNNLPINVAFHGGTITVTPTPEPASLAILGFATLALAVKRRARR